MKSTELDRVLDRLMKPPQIRTEPGFAARMLIPPGQMYDPLFMRDHGDVVLVNDDGGQERERGRQGQILAIDPKGNVSTVVAVGRFAGPPMGFDIASASFGSYRGQIFTVTQPEAGERGVLKAHIVQRVDPTAQRDAETVCTLPPAGQPWAPGEPWTGADGKGIASGGMEGRFGPDDSPFAGKFFGVTFYNSTVYQVTLDGACTPFVSFDPQRWGYTIGLGFSPNRQHMLVSMHQIESKGTPVKATIARVRSDGTVETEQLVRASPEKLISVWGMAYAPSTFGRYAGQLFMAANNEQYNTADRGKYRTHEAPEAGEVYRLTPEGELKLVATGFHTAVDVHFVGNRLWVSDVNADYSMGPYRELPDGFVVEITAIP